MLSFITDQSGATSNNTPTRGRLVEWCQLHVLPSKAISLQEWQLGKAIWFAEVEKHHRACVLCTMLCSGESVIKRSANVRALPGGGDMLYVERYIDSSAQGGDKACKGGGESASPLWGGRGGGGKKGTHFHGSQSSKWRGTLEFFFCLWLVIEKKGSVDPLVE